MLPFGAAFGGPFPQMITMYTHDVRGHALEQHHAASPVAGGEMQAIVVEHHGRDDVRCEAPKGQMQSSWSSTAPAHTSCHERPSEAPGAAAVKADALMLRAPFALGCAGALAVVHRVCGTTIGGRRWRHALALRGPLRHRGTSSSLARVPGPFPAAALRKAIPALPCTR